MQSKASITDVDAAGSSVNKTAVIFLGDMCRPETHRLATSASHKSFAAAIRRRRLNATGKRIIEMLGGRLQQLMETNDCCSVWKTRWWVGGWSRASPDSACWNHLCLLSPRSDLCRLAVGEILTCRAGDNKRRAASDAPDWAAALLLPPYHPSQQ